MSNYNKAGNIGWYIVPFSIKPNKQEAFLQYVEQHYQRSNRFDSCKYIFSYIKHLYTHDFMKCYTVPETVNGLKLDFGSIDNVEHMSTVRRVNTDLILFSNYMGFLVFKINYGELSIDEIEYFVYQFRRTAYTRHDGQDQHQSNLLAFIHTVLGGCDVFTKPFFYQANGENCNCNVLQLIYYPTADDGNFIKDEEYNRHSYLLGRGYNKEFSGKPNTQDSDVDMCYSPKDEMEWFGCQQVLTAIVNQRNHFTIGSFPSSMNNNYLYLYLILLNQRYAALYLMEELILADPEDNEILDRIENDLNDFRIYYSFYAVSNEMTYQNLYNRMLKVLDIEKLTLDVQDSSQRLLMRERKEKERREQNTNTILFAIGLLAIGSALIDISGFFNSVVDVLSKQSSPLYWIGIIISILAIGCVAIYAIRKYIHSANRPAQKAKKKEAVKTAKDNNKEQD